MTDESRSGRCEPVVGLAENSCGTESTTATPSQPERMITDEKPKLLVGTPARGETAFYVCSSCLRGFRLPANLSPMAAVKEMYRRFREHAELEHSESTEGPSKESAA